MADLMKQETLEATEMPVSNDESDKATVDVDAEGVYLDDDEDLMIGKYERPPTRRALTPEEFAALWDYINAPPKPVSPQMQKIVENYKRIKARLV